MIVEEYLLSASSNITFFPNTAEVHFKRERENKNNNNFQMSLYTYTKMVEAFSCYFGSSLCTASVSRVPPPPSFLNRSSVSSFSEVFCVRRWFLAFISPYGWICVVKREKKEREGMFDGHGVNKRSRAIKPPAMTVTEASARPLSLHSVGLY